MKISAKHFIGLSFTLAVTSFSGISLANCLTPTNNSGAALEKNTVGFDGFNAMSSSMAINNQQQRTMELQRQADRMAIAINKDLTEQLNALECQHWSAKHGSTQRPQLLAQTDGNSTLRIAYQPEKTLQWLAKH